MEPWGTPVLTGPTSDLWPSNKNKLTMISKVVPEPVQRRKTYCHTKTWEGDMRKESFCFFWGLRENSVYEELCFAFASYSLWGRLYLWNPVIKNWWRKRNMIFFFILLCSFSIIQKPQQLITYYLTKRNRYIVFIWNHISSLPFSLIQKLFKKIQCTLFLFLFSCIWEREY